MNSQQQQPVQPTSLQPSQITSPTMIGKQPKSPAVSTNLTKINITNQQKAPISS